MGIDHIFQSPLLIVTIRGFSTCEEIIGAFDELALDDRITSTESIIFDLLYADYAPAEEELKRIAEHLGSLAALRVKRWAVAAQQVSIMFGKIRLLYAFMKSNGLAAELFPSFTKAMTWALLG